MNNAGYGYGALEDVPTREARPRLDINLAGGGAKAIPSLRRFLSDGSFDALLRMSVRQASNAPAAPRANTTDQGVAPRLQGPSK